MLGERAIAEQSTLRRILLTFSAPIDASNTFFKENIKWDCSDSFVAH